MAATRKQRESLLNFDRGDDWVSPWEIQQREAEERRRKEEEENERIRQERLRSGEAWEGVSGSANTKRANTGIMGLLEDIDAAGQRGIDFVQEPLQGGGQRSIGGALYTADELGFGDPLRAVVESANLRGGGAIGDLLAQMQDLALNANTRESTQDMGQRLFETGSTRVQEARDRTTGTLDKGIVDMLSSPSSFASIVGGPAAGIGAADVFGQEYTAARLEGLNPQAAAERAAGQGMAEGILSVLPTGKMLGMGGDAAKRFVSDRARWAARTGATSVLEGIQEGFTTLAQLGLDKLTSETADDPELREYAKRQLPKDVTELWQQTKDSIVAGTLGGGTIGGSTNAMQTIAERGQLAADILNKTNVPPSSRETRRDTPITVEQPGLFRDLPTTGESFEAQEAQRQRELETDAGLRQGRQVTAREQNRAALRDSVVNRVDTARENVEILQEQVEAGDRSDATLSALARATREMRAAENTLTQFDETSARPVQAPVAGAILPAQEATQLNLGLPENPAQAAAIKEAQDLLKKDEAGVAKKAEKDRAKARAEALKPVIENTRDQMPEQRVKALSEATLAWDTANPMENFQAQAAVPTPVKKGRGQQRAQRAPATQTQETTTTNVDQLRAMADEALKPSGEVQIPGQVAVDTARAGLQRPSDTETSTTVRDVGQAIVRKLGGGDANVAGRLIAQGNIQLVETDTDIPAGAVALGSAGFYDGNKAYAVANRMNPDNIVGDLLDIAAHEVKHGGDLAASDTLRTSLPEFIGPEANTRIIRQIEALAERDAEVKKVVNLARSTGNYEAEVVNYFTDAMRDARARKPAIARIGEGILAATRTAAKRVLPGDYEINLNDVAYLSDKLLRETAIQNPNLSVAEGETADLSMIVPAQPGDTDTFVSRDRNIKKWITDADSSVRFAEVPQDRLTTTGVRLDEVLVHDELFRRHPELRDYTVVVMNDIPHGGDGILYTGAKRIGIHSRVANQGDQQYGYPHQVLLHEVQHIIQDNAGWEGGTNPDYVLIKLEKLTDKGKYNSLRAQVQGVANLAYRGDPDRAATILSNIYKVPFDKIVQIQDAVADPGTVDAMNRLAQTDNTKALNQLMRRLGTKIIDNLAVLPQAATSERIQQDVKALQELDALEQKRRALAARAEVMYYNNQGEIEARFTQQNLSVRSLATEDVTLDRPVSSTNSTLRTARGRAEGGVNPENLYGSEVLRDEEGTGGEPIAANPELMTDAPLILDSARISELREMLNSPNSLEREFASFMLRDLEKVPFVGLASKPFPRSVKIGDNKRMLDKIPRFIKRLLLPAGGHHEVVAQIMSYGQSLPASLAAQSTAFGNRFEDATKNAARKNNKTVDEIKTEVGKRVEKIDELETRAERVSATLALNRDFPGVGTTLNDLRDFKLAQAREIVNLRLRDPKPLEGKELAVYNKIIANAERYTTRAYLATYQKDIGERYGKNLLAKFNKDPNSREGRIVADAMEYLIHNELLVPDQAGLEAMSRGDLRRMYEAWYGNSARHTGKQGHANMLEKLSNMPPKTKEQVEAKALEVIEDMLGLTENQRARNVFLSPSVRQNRTVLEARSDMPEVLRTLMGEITDPVAREMISLQRMTNLRAKTVVLTELFEKTEGLAWSDHRTEKFNQQLNNVAYGPLDGTWISQDTADAITGTILNMHNVDEALATMAKEPDLIMKALLGQHLKASHQIMSLQKTMQVVLSPFNMVMNFTGALAIMAPMQGIVNPKTYARGIRDTVNVLALEISSRANTPTQLTISAELLEAQVVDSATMGEFKGNAWKTIIRDLEKMIDGGKLTPFKVIKTVARELFAAGEAANAARQLYAFMDVWVKVATYYDRKNFWEAYNKAEGGTMTPEQILRTAGREASGTNISYERAIPLARALERNVPLFMFLTYFSETFRSAGMSYVQAYRDLKLSTQATTPKGKALAASMGMKRLAGTLAMTAGIQAAVLAALDSEDEEEKKKRWLDADWMVDKILVPLGIDEAGNELMIELQRIDPIGPMNEFFIGIANAEEGKHAEAAMQGIVDMFVESKGAIAVGKLIWDLGVHSAATATGREGIREWEAARQKNTITERNYPKIYNYLRNHPVYGAGDLGENFIAAAERLMVPTAIMPTLDAERTAIAETRPDDLHLSDLKIPLGPIPDKPLGPVARELGYRAYTRDPDKALFFRVMDYNDQIKALRTKRDELNDAAPSMSESQLIDSLLDIREAEQEAFTKVQRGYEGYLAFEGKKPANAITIIDNKKLARSVRAGQFESQLLDGEAIDRWYKTQQGRRGVDKAELREKYRIMKRLYAEAK